MSLHQSRTIAALKAMDKNEFREFSGFVQSAFCKASPMVKKTFEYLRTCAPDFDKQHCNKEIFSEKIFRRKLDKAAGAEINRLMSELSDVIELFLAFKLTESEPGLKYDAAMRWYSKKRLDWHLNKVFKEVEDAILNNQLTDHRYAYKNYLEHKINYQVFKSVPEQSLLIFSHLQDFLQDYFAIEMEQCSTGLSNLKQILPPQKINDKTKPDFLKIDFKRELQFFKKLHQFLIQPDISTYRFLLKSYDDHTLHISDTDRNRLLILLQNSLTKLFHGKKYSTETIRIINHRLRQKNALYRNHVLMFDYRDMMLHLCALGGIEEAEKFQKEVGEKILGVKDVGNYIRLYHAHLLFEKKQFSEALKIISACSAEKLLNGIDIRILKVKIAYETNDAIQFHAHLNALRKFVATQVKKELPPIFEHRVLKFATRIQQLQKARQNGSKKLPQLKQEIEQDSLAIQSIWLLEKINQLLSGKNKSAGK